MIFTAAYVSTRHLRVGAVLVLLGLTGCAELPLPVPDFVYNDGPAPAKPAEITDADPTRALTGARPIRRADPTLKGRANLGDVPSRPAEFSTPLERQALMDRLQADRTDGQVAGDALRARSTEPHGNVDDIPTLPDAPPPVPQPLPRPAGT